MDKNITLQTKLVYDCVYLICMSFVWKMQN